MSEKQVKDEVLELIRWIDKHKHALFRDYDVFAGTRLVLLSLVYFLIVTMIFQFGNASEAEKLAVLTSFLAVVTAVFALITQQARQHIIKINFDRALKLGTDFSTNQKILLKALLKVKVKHRNFDLEQIYKMNPSMFTREKLLERLYEN